MANDAVIVIDEGQRILLVNQSTEQIFGYTTLEMIGCALDLLLPDESRDSHRTYASQFASADVTARSMMSHRREVRGRRKDGTVFPIDASIGRIELEGKTALVAIVTDITERKRTEEALRRHAEELQERNEELDAFAHTVAHDLQNPLSTIIGFSEVLSEGFALVTAEELNQILHTIANRARKMSTIIEELLLLSEVRKAQIGEMPVLDMGAVVNEALARLEPALEDPHVQIVQPPSWPPARGHAPWVEEVWFNYINNAIKYGGDPPRIELGATMLPDGMVRYWLHDNGKGLAPEDVVRLFTPFTRLSQVRAKGHGLGLSIVRRIVERLGGQVGVESGPGQGSTFSFTLPAAAG